MNEKQTQISFHSYGFGSLVNFAEPRPIKKDKAGGLLIKFDILSWLSRYAEIIDKKLVNEMLVAFEKNFTGDMKTIQTQGPDTTKDRTSI